MIPEITRICENSNCVTGLFRVASSLYYRWCRVTVYKSLSFLRSMNLTPRVFHRQYLQKYSGDFRGNHGNNQNSGTYNTPGKSRSDHENLSNLESYDVAFWRGPNATNQLKKRTCYFINVFFVHTLFLSCQLRTDNGFINRQWIPLHCIPVACYQKYAWIFNILYEYNPLNLYP